jgi:hypothetical protein
MGHDGAVKFRAAAVLVSLALLAAGCGGDDSADPEAFCDLIRRGVANIADQDGQSSGFADLLDVAPDEISDAVQELANTTGGLATIEELDQLFAAAFDPEAQAARTAFNDYAVEICGYEGEALSDGQLTSATDLLNDLQAFVAESFSGESWTSKVRYDIEEDEGALVGVRVTFILRAAGSEPVRACNAVSVWAYQRRGAVGEVSVVDDQLVAALRTGPDASGCTEV